MTALVHFFERELHIIAQIIKAELIIGAVGNIAGIGRLASAPIGFMIIDAIHAHAKEVINLPHPFRVAAS